MQVQNFNYVADNWKTLEFKDYDGDWLDFISQCRNGVDYSSYDIVIGEVANDKVMSLRKKLTHKIKFKSQLSRKTQFISGVILNRAVFCCATSQAASWGGR